VRVGAFLLSSVGMAHCVRYRRGSRGFGRRKFVEKLTQRVSWNVNKEGFNGFLLHSDSESGLIEGWKIQVGGINSTGRVVTG